MGIETILKNKLIRYILYIPISFILISITYYVVSVVFPVVLWFFVTYKIIAIIILIFFGYYVFIIIDLFILPLVFILPKIIPDKIFTKIYTYLVVIFNTITILYYFYSIKISTTFIEYLFNILSTTFILLLGFKIILGVSLIIASKRIEEDVGSTNLEIEEVFETDGINKKES